MLIEPIDRIQDKLSLADGDLEGVAVLVLPENIDDKSAAEWHDTPDGIELAKYLKSQGVECRTAFDLNLQPKVIDRRGIELWVGTVWILENVATPMVVDYIYTWLAAKLGRRGSNTIHLDLKLQNGKKTSSLRFEGSAQDFLHILSGLRSRTDGLIELDEHGS